MAWFRCISRHRRAIFGDPAEAKWAAIRIRIPVSTLSILLQRCELTVHREGCVHLRRDIEAHLLDANGQRAFDVLFAMKPYPQLTPGHV
jgi:hypothetical protein